MLANQSTRWLISRKTSKAKSSQPMINTSSWSLISNSISLRWRSRFEETEHLASFFFLFILDRSSTVRSRIPGQCTNLFYGVRSYCDFFWLQFCHDQFIRPIYSSCCMIAESEPSFGNSPDRNTMSTPGATVVSNSQRAIQ